MLPGKKYTPDEVVRIVRARWWVILLPFAIGAAGGLVAFSQLPVKYRSETLIMVVPQQIPDTYVKPTMVSRIEDRLPTIYEQILSRSRLERIISDFDLYKELRTRAVMEDVVQTMRAAIEVKLEGKESFRVEYTSHDPATAQRVTDRLASLFIEENLKDREHQAESTSQFLESQLEDAKKRLLAQEQKLEEYRRRHAGQLPSQLAGNLQSIQNAQLQLQALGESVNRARERRLLIERQIADAESLPLAPVVPSLPGKGPEGGGVTAAQQLEAAKAQLDSMRQRYTEDHPDVRALQRTIRDLQAKAAEEAARPPRTAAAPRNPLEAAAEKRVKDLQAELQVIDHQIATAQAEEARLRGVIGSIQAKVDVVPTRESELVELTRDYTTLQETYASLLAKREESKLAANLERQQIGERFRVLDPASYPEKPSNQKQRLGVLAGGAMAGLVLGIALVGFREYRDCTFRSEDDVVRVLALPVLALIPEMQAEAVGSTSVSVVKR